MSPFTGKESWQAKASKRDLLGRTHIDLRPLEEQPSEQVSVLARRAMARQRISQIHPDRRHAPVKRYEEIEGLDTYTLRMVELRGFAV